MNPAALLIQIGGIKRPTTSPSSTAITVVEINAREAPTKTATLEVWLEANENVAS